MTKKQLAARIPPKVLFLMGFLDMLLKYNSGGLLPIMDGVVPDTEDALAILDAENNKGSCESVHVQGNNGIEPIQSREERADNGIYQHFRHNGGIQNFVKAFAALRRNDNNAYVVLCEWSEYPYKYGTIEHMAEALNYANTQIYSVKNRGIKKVAFYISAMKKTKKGRTKNAF